MENTVKMFELINGKFIIGEEVRSLSPDLGLESDTIRLKNPMQAILQEDKFMTLPAAPLAKGDEISLRLSSVTFEYEPSTEIASIYRDAIQQISAAKAGIITPHNNIVGPHRSSRKQP